MNRTGALRPSFTHCRGQTMRKLQFHMFIPALFLVSAVAFPAMAATKDGSFAIRGFGAQSCGSITTQMREDPAAASAALAWVLGYTTAFNRVQADTFDVSPLVDGAAMLRMIIGTCEKTPDSIVETVAFEVLKVLARARVTESAPLVETVSGERKAAVRRETLQRIQSQLIQRGHLSGTADGVFGPQTSTALRAFQSAQKLPETGIADAATVVRLLIELPATAE